MTHPASRLPTPAGPAAAAPAGTISIRIREGASPYGRDLSFPRAIGQLRHGEHVTVVPVGTSAAGSDRAASPCSGSTFTVYPARTSPCEDEPPKVNWGSKGAVPAADAALLAETLTLASRLAMYAGLGETTPGAGHRPGAMAGICPPPPVGESW